MARPWPSGPVVVYGGGETGCETAEYLAAKGHSVVIVTRSDARQLARSAEAMYRKHLIKRLFANDRITILDNAMIEAIRGNVIIVRRRDGRNSRLDASALVAAAELIGLDLSELETDVDVAAFVAQRLAFIRDRNWAEADRIRDELLAQGIQLKDGKDPATGERVTTWEVTR